MAGNAWIWAWTSASSPKRLDTSLWSRPRSTRRCRSSAPGGSPSYLAPPGPKQSDANRRADSTTSHRAKLPEVADESLPLVDAPEAKLHGHLEGHRGGVAVGELTIEAAAAFQIGRHHHGRRIGTGHEVVLGEGEDLPAPGDLVVGERLRGALPAQVPPWIGDRAAVLALLAVEPKVLLLFAHGGGHAREGANHLGLHVAAEIEELAVLRQGHARPELRGHGTMRAPAREGVGGLEEQGLRAATVGDHEDLIPWLGLLEDGGETQEARGRAGVAGAADHGLPGHGRLGELELPHEGGMRARIRCVEDELGDVLSLAPRGLEEALDRLGDVLVKSVGLDEGHVGQDVEVAIALKPPHVGEVVARRVGALEGRDHVAVAHEHCRGAVADLRLL